ncbi:hypothetical protein TWF106_011224 [Orbilia oligospora]|uniref:Uncharacterized protein n=1 Tax=Orbilia oligospora TaxID=2813651 RepID=A0A7C8QUQ3_ORBOL|nr:hypothetical protein TWF106_011224 [Orbilia oligospora]
MPCTTTAYPFFDLYEDSILGYPQFQPSPTFWWARLKEMINEEYAILRVAQIYQMEAREPATLRNPSENCEPEPLIQRLRRASEPKL